MLLPSPNDVTEFQKGAFTGDTQWHIWLGQFITEFQVMKILGKWSRCLIKLHHHSHRRMETLTQWLSLCASDVWHWPSGENYIKQETTMPRCVIALEPALSTFLKNFGSLKSVRTLVLQDSDQKPHWVILLNEPMFPLKSSSNFTFSISRIISSTHFILQSKTLTPGNLCDLLKPRSTWELGPWLLGLVFSLRKRSPSKASHTRLCPLLKPATCSLASESAQQVREVKRRKYG